MQKYNTKKNILFSMIMLLVCLILISCSNNEITPKIEDTKIQIKKTSVIKQKEVQPNIEVVFINVGRADAALIMIDKNVYMIDTGTNKSILSVLDVFEYYNIDRIDGVFLTHNHKDHIGGMKELAERYKVDTIYSSNIYIGIKKDNTATEELADKLSIDNKKLVSGDKIGVINDVYFEVLAPIVYNDEDDNNNSLVLKLHAISKTFLFTGDMQFPEEATLIKKNINLSADILKVAHHGNQHATSRGFVNRVSPDIAIISTDTSDDKNSANERVLEALDDSKILITQYYKYGISIKIDADGSIIVSKLESNSNGIEIIEIDRLN